MRVISQDQDLSLDKWRQAVLESRSTTEMKEKREQGEYYFQIAPTETNRDYNIIRSPDKKKSYIYRKVETMVVGMEVGLRSCRHMIRGLK